MKSIHAFALAAGLCLSLSAAAQWQWVDSAGNKVFSDRPPPPDIPDKNVLRRPSGSRPVASVPPAAAASAAVKPGEAVPKVAGKDKELEEKRKQAEDAEASKKAAEQEKVAKAKAENCVRARQGKANYDSGVRIARTNAQGEREIIDDTTRAAETQRLQQIINTDCS
jgi:ubiquitin